MEMSKRFGVYVLLVVCAAVAVWLASFIPNADWYVTFDPTARNWLHGHSLYEQTGFMNPPWTVLILVPFVLFPINIARGLILVTSLSIYIYTAWRLQAPKVAVIGLLLSPTVIGSLLAGNLDALILLGMFLPPAWGVLILSIKPQIGFGVAIEYLVEAWRKNKWKQILRVFAPVALAYVVSGILFPVWVDRVLHQPSDVWNRSIFPYGLPIGFLLMWQSVRLRNAWLALAATPFFSPYLTFYTYLIVQIGLLHEDVDRILRRDMLQVFLCAFLWVVMLVFRL